MSIAIKCPGCGKSYSLREDLAGKRVKCKCGNAMKVPEVAAKPDEMAAADPLGSLLDDELPATEAALPGGAKPSPKAAGGPSGDSVKVKKKRKFKWQKPDGDLTPMANLLIGLGVVVGIFLVVGVSTLVLMWVFRPGFATPEQVFAAHQEALAKKKWGPLIRTYSTESHDHLVGGMLKLVSMPTVESSNSVKRVLKEHGVDEIMEQKDKSAGEASKPSADEPESAVVNGEEEEEKEEEANVAQMFFQDHEALAREAEQRCKKALSAIEDKPAFFVDFMAAMEAERDKQLPHNPVLQVIAKTPEGETRRTLAGAALDNLKIEDDTAGAEISFLPPKKKEKIVAPVAFKKSGGRWLMHIPSAEALESSPMRSTLNGHAKLNFISHMFY